MYCGEFENQNDIVRYFHLSSEDLQGCRILFAAYGCDYEGDAFVLFRKNRRLYEVNGSHCSCYGLEDQWEPEETHVKALRHRLENGRLGYFIREYQGQLFEVLESLERKKKKPV